MPKLIVKNMILLSITLLIHTPYAGLSVASTQRVTQAGPMTNSCEEVASELARFKNVMRTWGSTMGGDPQSALTFSSAEGERLTDAVTFYKSKSRFNKRVRQLDEEVIGITGRSLLLDGKGRSVGQRVVKEIPAQGQVTTVMILLVTDRKIQAISAPSLKLALALERSNLCQIEAARRLTTHSTGLD